MVSSTKAYEAGESPKPTLNVSHTNSWRPRVDWRSYTQPKLLAPLNSEEPCLTFQCHTPSKIDSRLRRVRDLYLIWKCTPTKLKVFAQAGNASHTEAPPTVSDLGIEENSQRARVLVRAFARCTLLGDCEDRIHTCAWDAWNIVVGVTESMVLGIPMKKISLQPRTLEMTAEVIAAMNRDNLTSSCIKKANKHVTSVMM